MPEDLDECEGTKLTNLAKTNRYVVLSQLSQLRSSPTPDYPSTCTIDPQRRRKTVSCNFMNKDRWIEIQFAYLCFKLYNSLNDYVWATNYILFLADLSHVDHKKAMRLLQKVNQINAIRPTSTEFICIARQNKMTIERICKALHISKSIFAQN